MTDLFWLFCLWLSVYLLSETLTLRFLTMSEPDASLLQESFVCTKIYINLFNTKHHAFGFEKCIIIQRLNPRESIYPDVLSVPWDRIMINMTWFLCIQVKKIIPKWLPLMVWNELKYTMRPTNRAEMSVSCQ